MAAGDRLYSRFTLITSGEKLADRFLYTGSVPVKPGEDGPTMLFSIEVTRPWFPSSRLVPSITNVLTQRYSTIKRSNNPLKSFEAALKNVNEELFAIADQGETDWIGHLNAIIALVVEDEVHIAQTGSSTAYLFRQRKISQITDESGDQSEPHPLTTFSNIISGQVTEGDRLVLSNQDLFALVSLDQVRAAVTDQTPWLAANQLVRNIRRGKISSISTAILAMEKHKTWLEAGEEPFLVNLEESLQAWHKQAWKKTKPYFIKASDLGKQAWHTTQLKARDLHQKWQESYGPKTKELIQIGASKVGAAAQTVAQSAKETAGKASEKTKANNYLAKADAAIGTWVSSYRTQLTPAHKSMRRLDTTIAQLVQKVSPWLTGKNVRYVVITLAVVFIITTVISVRGKHSQQLTSEQSDQNITLLEEVQTLSGKIDTVISQKQTLEAQNLITEAEQKLAQVKNPTEELRAERDTLISILQEKGDKLSGTTRLTHTNALEAPDNSQQLISTEKGVAAFTAKTDARFFVKELAGSQQNFTLENPLVSVTYNQERDELLALTNNKTVVGIRRENDQIVITKKENPLGDFAEAQFIATFANNLYMLDNANSLIWKYPPSGDNFQRGINQIEPADVSVAGALDFTIDGHIYVLSKDGTIIKLLRGKPDTTFSLNGLPKQTNPANFARLYTSDNTDYLFVLDKGDEDSVSGPRVILLTKDGLYTKQYAFSEDINVATDFAVDTNNKTFWILTGNQVYEYQF